MGAAAAQIVGKLVTHIRLAWLGIAVEQRLRLHDYSWNAVAALRRLLCHECRLQRMRPFDRSEALECGDLGLAERIDRRYAGARRFTIDQNRASAALSEPAAELGGIET